MRLRIPAVALGVIVAGVLGVPGAPAQAVDRSWNQYQYTPCGVFKGGVRGFVATIGDVNINSDRTRVDDAIATVSTSTCPGTARPTTVDRVRARLQMTFNGHEITSCTVGFPPSYSCTVSQTQARADSGWITAPNDSNYTIRDTNSIVYGNIDTLVATASGNWIEGSNNYSRHASSGAIND